MTYDAAYKIAKQHSELPVIIDGPHAPTGKSTLRDRLRAEGRTAYEQWELEQGETSLEEGAYLLLIVDEVLPRFHKVR